MLPSRDRPNELATCLNGFELEKNGAEALIWLDDDEPQLSKYKEILKAHPNAKVFIKKRVGYIGTHLMNNFLSEQAKYDWVLQFNDDAYLDNPDWFTIFKDFASQFDPLKEPVVINWWGQGETKANLFPIVSRKYLQLLGHYSMAPVCDEYVREVALGAGISHDLKGIKPKHRKYGSEDPLRDQTFREVENDRVVIKKIWWNEKRGVLPKSLQGDINKIINYKNGENIIFQAA